MQKKLYNHLFWNKEDGIYEFGDHYYNSQGEAYEGLQALVILEDGTRGGPYFRDYQNTIVHHIVVDELGPADTVDLMPEETRADIKGRHQSNVIDIAVSEWKGL